MTTIIRNTDASTAIERSRSHDEIVTILASSADEAKAIVSALRAAADEDTDTAENGSVTEVWGYDAESDDDSTAWRVHVEIRDELEG